ncbi:MAG: chemotaxis protein CheW [Armatimonadota bacterium]|nr:chemotaxis protein CheW [Armatimonadota bacterium]
MNLDSAAATVAPAQAGGQYLTFTLGEEAYGLPILAVQEIRGYAPITRVPNTPPHVRGVMNLRGTIVPVVDLRTRLGLAETVPTPFTVIVVVTVAARSVGLIVDAVSDVLDLGAGDLEPPPEFGSGVDVRFITGVARSGGRLILLLSLERVLDREGLEAVPGASCGHS